MNHFSHYANEHDLSNKQLAQEVAERLREPENYPLYLSYAQRLPHEQLREKLEYVCSLPDEKIIQSRASYFVFLIERLKEKRPHKQLDIW
jgi:hypothetical protein